MNKNLRRSVVALATAFACLTALANPASAAFDIVTITGGTITATSTTGQVITTTLGGTTGAGCTSSIIVETPGSHSGTSNITTYTSVGHFTLGTTHYVATMTRTASTSGTYGTSSNGGTITSSGLSVNVVIRAAANNTSTNLDCTTTGTTLCTLRATLHFTGTYTGHMSDISSTFTISSTPAAITLGIGTCMVPFSTFNGGTATATAITGHTTSTS